MRVETEVVVPSTVSAVVVTTRDPTATTAPLNSEVFEVCTDAVQTVAVAVTNSPAVRRRRGQGHADDRRSRPRPW